MKILQITSITNPEGNGVAVAVTSYFKHEQKLADVALYNLEKSFISSEKSYNYSDYNHISDLPNGFDVPDLVIFNEVYKPMYLRLYKECIRRDIPYIVIPHGCLTKQSQKKKKLKKTTANLLVFNRFVRGSSAVQYLNEYEKNNTIMKKHNCIVSGNGIDVSKNKSKYADKDFVYIGRYDIDHKGLDLIVETVAENKKWFIDNNVKVRLYGRGSGSGYEDLKKMIYDHDISNILTANEAVYGDIKKKLLLKTYAFIQTSRYEGQPMGLLEALAYGIPCIVTYGTSFGEYVNKNECGIGIKFDKEAFFNAMKRLYSDEDFRNKCAKNTIVVERDYKWEKVISGCLEKYAEIINSYGGI